MANRFLNDVEINGNVGIGTTSPSQKLDVAGNVSLGKYAGSDFNRIIGLNDAAGVYGAGSSYIKFEELSGTGTSGTTKGGNIRFYNHLYNGGTNETLSILANGNVGIGVDSPSYKLQVQDRIHIIDTTNLQPKISFSENTNSSAQFALEYNGAGGGTGNYVSFYSEQSGWVSKGNGLNYIPSNGFVGIGTATPAQPFQVDAGSNIASFRSVGTGQNNKELLIQTGGDRVVLDAKNADDGTAASLAFELGNSEKARLTTVGLGIGTTSPGAKLDVEGSVNNADIGIRISNTFDDNNAASEPNSSVFLNAASNNGYLRVHGAPADAAAKHRIDLGSTAATSFLTFSPSGSERMRIKSSGNVGIGTTNPAVKLQIGDGTEDTSVRAYHSDASYTEMRGYGLQFNRESSYIRPTSDGNKTMYFGTSGATWNAIVFDATIYDFKTNATSRLSIDASGNANFANNVTVGGNLIVNGTTTTLSTQTVEVEDNILQLNTTQGTPDTATAATSGISVYRGDGVTQASLVFDEADDTWDLTNSLAVAGNVGIGTTSPQSGGGSASWLSLNGTAAYSGGVVYTIGSVTKAYSYFESDYLKQQAQGGYGQKFIVNGTNTAMTILSGGNVGIGTASPRSILETKGNVSIFDPTNYLSDGDTLNGLHFYTDEFSYNPPAGRASTPISKIVPVIDSSGTDSFGLSFYTSGTDAASSEKFRISSGGLVGIGTTSPQYKLEVSGTGQVTSRVISTNNQGARFDLHSSGGAGGRYSQQALANGDFFMYDEKNSHTIQRYYDGATGAWVWFTAGTEKMRITSTGAIDFGGAGFGTSGQLLTSNANGSPTWQDAPASGAETVTVTGSTGSRTTTIVEGLNLAGVENLGMPTTGGYTVMGISNGSGSVAAGTVVSFHDSDSTESDDSFAVDLRSNGDYFWNMHGKLTIGETNQNRGGDLQVENDISWGADLAGANASGQQLIGMSNGDSISASSVHIGASGKVHLHGSSGGYNLEIHQTGAAAIELNAFTGELQVAGAGITPGTDASPNALGVGADGRLQTVNVGYTPLAVTKNGSNQFPVVFANAENFSLSCAGTWTIAATIASGDIGKTGTIIITNTATTTPGSLPSTFKTPNGDSIVFQTDSGDVSILSYLVVSTSIVLVNYVGNFS